VGNDRWLRAPITSGTLRPSREACESCHYPAMEHHDSVAVKVHYGTDPESSESRTRIVLHTGMDVIRQGYTKGIHCTSRTRSPSLRRIRSGATSRGSR